MLRREDVRRGIALVALALLVVLLVAGAAHAGGHDRAARAGDCGTCVAVHAAHAPLVGAPAPAALAPALLERMVRVADAACPAAPERRTDVARAPPVLG